jgi:hypothetical protein
MSLTPHKEKLLAALDNPKCRQDRHVLEKSIKLYEEWIKRLAGLTSKGKKRVEEMVKVLNWYKDEFEVELIMKQGSDFLKRQKGQLKLDSSILEEFLIYLINCDIISGVDNIECLKIGPSNALMSFAFFPESIEKLTERPNIVIKAKDQDFAIGTEIHYKFSTKEDFTRETP